MANPCDRATKKAKNHGIANSGKKPETAPSLASSEELTQLLSKLRPFQKEAFDFAIKGKVSQRMKEQTPNFDYDPDLLGKGRILIGDEMGLGKTVTSLAIMAHYRQEWPLLILCPASLRHMWPAEIEKFLPSIPPQSVYVVSGFNDIGFHKRKDVQVVVVTYSLLQQRSAVAQLLLPPNTKSRNGRNNDIAIDDDESHCLFQCVIADESHNLKQKNSQRSQLALPILQQAQRLLLLSGTPALARPVELWLQAHALAPDLFGNYSNYTKTYCDAKRKFGHWDVSGVSNAPELHSKLKQIMVRRLKCDVLHELPAKQRMVVPMNIKATGSAEKERIKDNQQLMQDLKDTRLSVSELMGGDQRTANFEAQQLFMQAYQASGIAKAGAVAEYLVDWMAGAGTQKVLVFAHHKAVMDVLELAVSKHLKGVGHIRIDGSVNSNDRAKLVRKFQTSPQVRVGILSMTAAGVGLTLTAASNVMFAELHYTPGVLAQAEDRAHRIGQKNAVNIMYFVCKDETISVDNAIWKMLGRKVGTLEQVIDGGSGKERAALSAKTANAIEGKSENQRQSGQEELTAFFAETASDVATKKQPRVAVKGSILSFFKKASSPNPNPAATTESQTATTEGKKKVSKTDSTKKATDDKIEWQCTTCTFINQKKSSSYLPCEMCGELFVPDGGPRTKSTPRVTPMSVPRSAKSTAKTSQHTTASKPPNNVHSTPLARAFRKSSSQASPSAEVIISDENFSHSPEANTARKANPQEILVIIDSDDDAPPKKITHARKSLTPPVIKTQEMLTFSVSKNTGRITLHYKEDGSSSLINFDVHDVITEKTADALADAQTTRANMTAASVPLQFNQKGIEEVIQKLASAKLKSRKAIFQMGRELESFVTSFLALREIERKVIKDAGEPFSSRNLSQAATKIMVGVSKKRKHGITGTAITERYTGGAKERAEERLHEGNATSEDMEILKGRNCSWCGGGLSRASRIAQSVYCSQECAETGRLRRGGMYASCRIRDQVFALEGGVCQICSIDAHALFLRIKSLHPAQRLSALCNTNFKLPKSAKALERLLQDPTEGLFWQADHIQAVAEGGGGCGLENLRTLCVPCHSLETEKLRGRLKLNGGVSAGQDCTVNAAEEGGKGKQMDIRSIFSAKKQARNK